MRTSRPLRREAPLDEAALRTPVLLKGDRHGGARAPRVPHRRIRVPVVFCDPRYPSQRGSNESTNGSRCQYFPTGARLANVSGRELDAVAGRLIGSPRQRLGSRCPAEAHDKAVASST